MKKNNGPILTIVNMNKSPKDLAMKAIWLRVKGILKKYLYLNKHKVHPGILHHDDREIIICHLGGLKVLQLVLYHDGKWSMEVSGCGRIRSGNLYTPGSVEKILQLVERAVEIECGEQL